MTLRRWHLLTTSYLLTDTYLLAYLLTNESIVWIVGEGGTVLTTTDGGANWRLVVMPEQYAASDFYGLYFISEVTGYVVGSMSGVVLSTGAFCDSRMLIALRLFSHKSKSEATYVRGHLIYHHKTPL